MPPKKSRRTRSHHARGGKRAGSGRRAGPQGKTITVSVSMPEGIVEQLDARADELNSTRSELIVAAVKKWLAAS